VNEIRAIACDHPVISLSMWGSSHLTRLTLAVTSTFRLLSLFRRFVAIRHRREKSSRNDLCEFCGAFAETHLQLQQPLMCLEGHSDSPFWGHFLELCGGIAWRCSWVIVGNSGWSSVLIMNK